MVLLWQQCVNCLSQRLDQSNFTIWICPLQPVFDDDTLTLFAPNHLIVNKVQTEYLALIQEVLARFTRQKLSIRLRVGSGAKQNIKSQKPARSVHERILTNRLNPEQTFDTFVAGESNRLAYNAACTLAEQTAAPKLLYIYGNIGCGKTHLLNAVGVGLLRQNQRKKICFFPAEQLALSLLQAMRQSKANSSKLETLKRKLRASDILLIDDLKMLVSKPWVQKEFLILYDFLLARGCQIVLTDEHGPNQLPLENLRLVSRLTAGLCCQITHPSQETLFAIIRQKSRQIGLGLSEEICQTIVARIEPSVRVIEGILQRLVVEKQYHSKQFSGGYLKQHDFSVIWIEAFLEKYLQTSRPQLSPESLLERITQHFDISPSKLCSGSKQKDLVQARHIAMSLLKDLTQLSLPKIATLFSCNHTTVLNATRRVKKQRENSPQQDQEYTELMKALSQ